MNFEWPGISKERLGFVSVYGVEAQESQHHGTYVEGTYHFKGVNLEKERDLKYLCIESPVELNVP